jgi:hypothetical protein
MPRMTTTASAQVVPSLLCLWTFPLGRFDPRGCSGLSESGGPPQKAWCCGWGSWEAPDNLPPTSRAGWGAIPGAWGTAPRRTGRCNHDSRADYLGVGKHQTIAINGHQQCLPQAKRRILHGEARRWYSAPLELVNGRGRRRGPTLKVVVACARNPAPATIWPALPRIPPWIPPLLLRFSTVASLQRRCLESLPLQPRASRSATSSSATMVTASPHLWPTRGTTTDGSRWAGERRRIGGGRDWGREEPRVFTHRKVKKGDANESVWLSLLADPTPDWPHMSSTQSKDERVRIFFTPSNGWSENGWNFFTVALPLDEQDSFAPFEASRRRVVFEHLYEKCRQNLYSDNNHSNISIDLRIL